MLIGQDFEKIQWDLLGLHLLEPNVFMTDALVFIVALVLAQKVKKFGMDQPFFQHWYWFFVLFGLGFFVGGLGHLFFSYFGIPGKFPALYLGIISALFIERAMVSLLDKVSVRKLLYRLIYIKLALALIAATLVFTLVDLSKDPSIALRVTSINAALGSIFALGFLGIKFARSITPSFHYLWLAILVFLPTALFQSLKINPHPWFDRNDASHVFIIASMVLYYWGVRGYARTLK